MENIYFETKSGLITVSSPSLKKGDVNGDGTINLADVSLVLRMALKIENYSDPAADVNEDGVISMKDARMILKAVLKIQRIDEQR